MLKLRDSVGHCFRSFLLARFFFGSFFLLMFTLLYSGAVLKRSNSGEKK
jgi:hypothetical protein